MTNSASSFSSGPFGSNAAARQRRSIAFAEQAPFELAEPEHRPIGEVISEMTRELWLAARRYPRIL